MLLSLKNIYKSFPLDSHSKVTALDNVSLSIYKGETLGIVGESGCGKTTLGRVIMGIYSCDKGTIRFNDSPLSCNTSKERFEHAKKMQMIFQDSYSALDPRMTIEQIIMEGMNIHSLYSKEERKQKVLSLIETVGLHPSILSRYPSEFSGGQLQRINIARALAMEPEVLILDEPTSALDVSIQSQILNLLKQLQQTLDLTYLFISHNLNVVRYMSDRIAVMYLGHIVEIGPSESVFKKPYHPYTKVLLTAALHTENKGIVETTTSIVEGCPFQTNCPKANDICKTKPTLDIIEENHFVACHLYK